MNNKLLISDKEKEALINYLLGNFSKTDSELLNLWLGKSDENNLLFDQFNDIWQASQYAQINKNIDINLAWDDIQNQIIQQQEQKSSWKKWLQIAAIIIFSVLAGGLGNYFLNGNQKLNKNSQLVEYVAPLGSRSFIKLNDGSKVWLNSGTTIKYQNDYGINNRDIELSGEALFKVEKNKHLPFNINAGELTVTALGTQFNVKAYNEENTIETTLLEGSVKITGNSIKLGNDPVLKPNQMAVLTRNKDEESNSKYALEIIDAVDTRSIVSWKEERWIISNEKLGSLSVKLARRYDVNFIFDNEILKEYAFGGTLEDETLEQILEAISYTAPVNYVIDNKTVYIMADGKKMEKFKEILIE